MSIQILLNADSAVLRFSGRLPALGPDRPGFIVDPDIREPEVAKDEERIGGGDAGVTGP
jgi:hypothetical protein